ncbi:lytic transglycosylase domain-containing protein [Clostridium sp. SYSU_GA19001]|uniref:lytic transglycosylase domain-containing protein n=1 Tax=Clostridium caldaquaticum TaxID=2940653 RepID=UPI0020779416|nr:lytic transglycosylase domain-containing protein [Clostridium caldaquaticum]MCM8710357.1 lytic transglycosylase domain-containing protein [Clostridium caldaquaticum]
MRFKSLTSSFILVIILLLIINVFYIVKLCFPLRYTEWILRYSKEYDLSPYLVAAVIKTESNFKPKAKSNKGAYGLMQITSLTGEWAAKEMKIENYKEDMLLEPEFNIKMGCWYIDNLKKEFKGNMDLVLAAYNGGRGNVQKWLADLNNSKDGKNLHYIPFKETDQYVKRVKVNYNIYKFLYGKKLKVHN